MFGFGLEGCFDYLKVFQYASEQAHIASTNLYYYELTSTQEAGEERGTNGARACSVTQCAIFRNFCSSSSCFPNTFKASMELEYCGVSVRVCVRMLQLSFWLMPDVG